MAKNTPTKSKKKVDGHAVSIWDYKVTGAARFVAYYDALPASVSGKGATKADALRDLERAASAYGDQRRAEIAREDWAQHEADKADALDRGDY